MTDNPTSLYTAWLGALPQMFRAMMPPAGAATVPDGAPADAPLPASLPFPVDQIGKAMQGLDAVLTQLYHAYLPLLAQGTLGAAPIKALADTGTQMFARLLQGFGGAGAGSGAPPAWTGLAQAVEPWSSLMRGLLPADQRGAADADALKTGIERAFGGLGDAFGLGPVRELEQAWRDALHAGIERQRAQAEYLGLVVEAWSEGTRHLMEQLGAMGGRGERVESLLGFIRLWAKAVDGPLHDAMQGRRGLELTARLMRASTRHREQMQKAVELASEALHMPTRADVDEAYREIQQLKREVRRLRKSLPQPAPSAPRAAGEASPGSDDAGASRASGEAPAEPAKPAKSKQKSRPAQEQDA